MRSACFFFITAVICFSCGTKEQGSDAPAINYTMKKVHVDSGCQQDTIPCATFDVTYPVFSGLSLSTDSLVNLKIEQATGAENPESEGKSLEEMGQDFIRGFEAFKAEAGEEFPLTGWMTNTVVNVDVVSDTLISLSVNSEFFTGGAHGGLGTSYINIDPTNGRDITLDNMLRPGYLPALTAAGDRAFRTAREIAPEASLSEEGFEFPDGRFQLNENYQFKKEGIAFFFNSYEIAPYAAGPTEIMIPYEEIKDWLRK